MEKLKDGKRNETLGFQVTLVCMFNSEEEKFEFTAKNNLVIYREA